MGLLDLAVRHLGVGHLRFDVDISNGHTVLGSITHDTDRYRRVRLTWREPNGESRVLYDHLLDLKTGEELHPNTDTLPRGKRGK